MIMNRPARILLIVGAFVAVGVFPAPLLAQNSRQLARAVKMRLEGSAELGFSRLQISVEDGVVTLNGRLPTLGAIVEAQRLAGRVHGIIEVENKIELDARRRSPARLESKVKEALAERLALSWADIKVRVTRGGRVVLSGKVGDARFRFAAFKAVSRIEGVVEIIDEIESPDAQDELIEKSLRGVFARGDLVGMSGEVELSVKHGTATLYGTVPRPYERMRATELALGVNGVRRVINRLVVRPVSFEVPVMRPR